MLYLIHRSHNYQYLQYINRLVHQQQDVPI
nr:MAG TPA: hypothetical protein [Caudoviricetes sp.]